MATLTLIAPLFGLITAHICFCLSASSFPTATTDYLKLRMLRVAHDETYHQYQSFPTRRACHSAPEQSDFSFPVPLYPPGHFPPPPRETMAFPGGKREEVKTAPTRCPDLREFGELAKRD
ncbi:uncharacterized protein PgNI_07440 [Pyricularia grisea]|uniref:Secreted protein n=1 Tax=Pyricularia grisea TaxID=148305 RepID=A0A6P8B132_PYRGI|nr:uncharacterized protein PgNI_07440 [Pyricularia grisea]TLD08423.1 hypothetical protein PgNI_07440 [Pyricularia grisea]